MALAEAGVSIGRKCDRIDVAIVPANQEERTDFEDPT
jgi:hypothetical protein